MNTIRIRILDDEPGKRKVFHDKILSADVSEEFDIGLIYPTDVRLSFEVMLARQNRFRENGFWTTEERMPLDDAHILVVDNELREFFQETGIFTGADEVAYMARCFSKCKLVVTVNRTTYNPFDLTGNGSFLGQFEAFSDIEIGQDQLASKVLWGTGVETFQPWYWFVLPKWLDEFDQRVQDAKSALCNNVNILSFFGLEGVKEWLPRRVLQSLGEGKDYTFVEFLRTSSFALSPRDRETLVTQALTEQSIDSLTPIVAARLWKWLETQVLPELDILIDAPHLVARFPSLLDGDRGDARTWSAVAVRHDRDVPNLKMDALEAWRFPRTHWLTRPAWYWRKVMNDENIPDVSEPWNIEYVPFAFCEDTSRFVAEDQAKSYRAEVDSPFGLRYIEKQEDVDYQPLQRLAL